MYVRLVVTFCSSEKVIKPKEAHIDLVDCDIHSVLNDCICILNKKFDKIANMVPDHLKNKDFEIIVHGNYLLGTDWDNKEETWTVFEPIFNIQQLGLPEEHRPLIKTV